MILLPGQFRFDVVRVIGRGGLGVVEEIIVQESVNSHPVGTRLARKRLNDKWKDHPEAQARFEREIIAVAEMSHPRIVAHAGENLAGGPERFYVMPLYGRSLRDYLTTRNSGSPLFNVVRFGLDLANALSYAHNNGFIHRDLKPENILLDTANCAIIADWGLGYFVHKASKVLAKLTHAGMGTEYYCSLEQWNSGKCDVTGDVYSLGLVLAELLTGRQVPIKTVGMGINYNVLSGAAAGMVEMNLLLRQMTYVLPRGRIQTMSEVAQRLSAIAGWEPAMAI